MILNPNIFYGCEAVKNRDGLRLSGMIDSIAIRSINHVVQGLLLEWLIEFLVKNPINPYLFICLLPFCAIFCSPFYFGSIETTIPRILKFWIFSLINFALDFLSHSNCYCWIDAAVLAWSSWVAFKVDFTRDIQMIFSNVQICYFLKILQNSV